MGGVRVTEARNPRKLSQRFFSQSYFGLPWVPELLLPRSGLELTKLSARFDRLSPIFHTEQWYNGSTSAQIRAWKELALVTKPLKGSNRAKTL